MRYFMSPSNILSLTSLTNHALSQLTALNCFFGPIWYPTEKRVVAQKFVWPRRVPHGEHAETITIVTGNMTHSTESPKRMVGVAVSVSRHKQDASHKSSYLWIVSLTQVHGGTLEANWLTFNFMIVISWMCSSQFKYFLPKTHRSFSDFLSKVVCVCCLSMYVCMYPSVHPPILPYIHLPTYLSVCLSIHPFIHPPTYLSVCLSVYPSIHPPT